VKLLAILAGLLLPSPAAAQPGDSIADYGHAVPGHSYDYVVYYRNSDSIEVTVAKDKSGCGSCPNLRLRYEPVAPGDSLPLHFRLMLEPGDTGAATLVLPVIVTHGDRNELKYYTMAIDGLAPRTVAPATQAIAVQATGQDLLSGNLRIGNISDQRIRIEPAGLPPGLSFSQASTDIKPGRSASLTFRCAVGALLQHRSLTFRVIREGKEVERFSLPLVEQ
jgi:hypothetical protein